MDLLLPICYAGPIPYYALQLKHQAIFENAEHFQKQTFRNRMIISGPNGNQNLIVPVKHKGQHLRINEVEIANNENWQNIHWRSLESCYRSSPYFEFYEDQLKPLYEKEYSLLWDFNMDMHLLILELLQIHQDTRFTDTYEKSPADKLDLRGVFSSKSGMALYNVTPYLQTFPTEGSLEHNSILDLLFNLGPESRAYLHQLKPANTLINEEV